MNAHFLRGQVLQRQQRYKEAAAEYQLAIGEDPDNPVYHAVYASALLQCDRWHEALERATTALTKDPSCAFVHWVMALVRLDRNQLKEAEESIQTAIELDPDDADHHGLLARVHFQRENYEAALKAADSGLALDPKNDLSLTFRSRALMRLGRESEARRDADALLADDPDDAWNHCLRGEQLLAEGAYNGARQHYIEALRLDPRNEAARQGLAVSLKARSPIYSVVLQILLWSDRFRAWAVWLVLILLFVGMRLGNAWTREHPNWIVPYEAAVALFWGVTILLFIANPLFDLLLRFDPETRHVLTDDEVKATNWYLVCFGFAALCGVWASFGKAGLLARTLGITGLYFTRAISEVFESTPGYVRRRMAGITIFAAACLVLTPVILVAGLAWIISTKQTHLLAGFVRKVLWIPLAVILYTVCVDNIRQYFERQRPS